MERNRLTINDRGSYYVAIGTFIGSFLFFFYYSQLPLSSLAAAAMASGCVWMAYVIIRWLFLASYK